MLETIAIGVGLGVLVTIARRWRTEVRESRRRAGLAAVLVHEELTAAISSLDLALREVDARWLVSMSESATLIEVWREHGRALAGLGPKQWEALDKTVGAMAPRPALTSAENDAEFLRRSLTETRSQLMKGARILRAVLDQLPTDNPPSEFPRLRSLLG